MKKNHALKKAFIANIILALLEAFAVTWMMSGLSKGILSGSGLKVLKYFTIDSNIYLGVASFLNVLELYMVLKGKKPDISPMAYLLKLSGTAAVTVTMLVTVFFLEPTLGKHFGYLALFSYSNFFLHLLNPLVAIVVWIRFEKNRVLSIKHTLLAVIPTLLYAVYYFIEVLRHIENGSIMPGYDWYGFFALGLKSAIVVLPLFLLFAYLVCFVLYRLGRDREP
ncbi:MAG: hypothetical protein IIW22_02070 [Erysipelotrichaceae bacterium]|nr:hypothetical protein [Erysipelotrichaceae bacterium]